MLKRGALYRLAGCTLWLSWSPKLTSSVEQTLSEWGPWRSPGGAQDTADFRLDLYPLEERPQRARWSWEREDLFFSWGSEALNLSSPSSASASPSSASASPLSEAPLPLEGVRRAQHCSVSFVDQSRGATEASLQLWLQRALRSRGGLLLHSGGGSYKGEGWVIPGVSGAGKTTAVKSAGFELCLSDEAVAVTSPVAPDASWLIWGTPFWSAGREAPLVNASVPLRWIAFPRKGAPVSFKPCSPSEAAWRLLRAVFAYEEGTEAMGALLESSCLLCEQVSSGLLTFPRFGPWIEEARRDAYRATTA